MRLRSMLKTLFTRSVLKFMIAAELMGALAHSAAARADASYITPLMGAGSPPASRECRSLVLDGQNAVGFLSLARDTQTVNVRILYRAGANRPALRLELRMMREDAELLRSEVEALLDKKRARPLRFTARRERNGACVVSDIAA